LDGFDETLKTAVFIATAVNQPKSYVHLDVAFVVAK